MLHPCSNTDLRVIPSDIQTDLLYRFSSTVNLMLSSLDPKHWPLREFVSRDVGHVTQP